MPAVKKRTVPLPQLKDAVLELFEEGYRKIVLTIPAEGSVELKAWQRVGVKRGEEPP
ncbi:MAG: hypothetical protein QW587_04830 [Candidatus Bathyarchaeia archaeon]